MSSASKTMPFLVLGIATIFHALAIFGGFEVSIEHIVIFDGFLTPLGLGGLLRAAHKTAQEAKKNAATISEADKTKLVELVNKYIK